MARSKPASIDRHVVGTLRVPVGIAWLVGSERAVREAVVTAVHLPLEARLEARPAGGIRGRVVLLHAEQMRRQA